MKKTLEESILAAVKFEDKVRQIPQLQSSYDRFVNNVAKKYDIEIVEVTKMVHDYKINNGFYKGLEDNG